MRRIIYAMFNENDLRLPLKLLLLLLRNRAIKANMLSNFLMIDKVAQMIRQRANGPPKVSPRDPSMRRALFG